jgi:hypothetical protein
MAEEETVPKVDWGSSRVDEPECGTAYKFELSPSRDPAKTILTIRTELGLFQFAILKSHIPFLQTALDQAFRHRG